MKQLIQKLKDGEVKVVDVPEPRLAPNNLLVQNYYSLISSGTEGTTAKTAQKSLIGKAKERPEQVKQVIDVLKKQGPVQTYRAVNNKLEAYSPCGYSSAGIVIDVGNNISEFKIGDIVACAGVGYANHAEIVSVPVNLCVKLSQKANLKNSVYNTLGAIAMQGVRQADLRLGESCAVIGLGLIGHLTSVLLSASGVNVIGIDISDKAIEAARNNCTEFVFNSNNPGIYEKILALTSGYGVDSVIITAGSSSLAPINLAGQISRKKGKVVVVGAIPTGFDRNPYYYPKELELKMSCSYGPGRYDIAYETKGIDYPYAYVRWTEKRNMEAFQRLLESGKINIDYLTTNEYSLDDAPKAYSKITNPEDFSLGIVLKYDTKEPIIGNKIYIQHKKNLSKESNINIGFIGAGSYAQNSLLPNIPKNNDNISLVGIMTNSGTTSRRVAERFNFDFCTSAENNIIDNDKINTVFIATHHNTHADFIKKCIRHKKHVFVEKPIATNIPDLEEIKNLYCNQNVSTKILVGFNRRFSPLAINLKKSLGNGPVSMIYRINAGNIPSNSWIQDKEIGGGRIIGEICHFIDFMVYISDSLPIGVYASALPNPEKKLDILNINIEFQNGSIGTISYFSNGSKALFKEYIEVYKSGLTGVIKDFRTLELYSSKKKKIKKMVQDKGQTKMLELFFNNLDNNSENIIDFKEVYYTSLTCFKIHESIKKKKRIEIDLNEK